MTLEYSDAFGVGVCGLSERDWFSLGFPFIGVFFEMTLGMIA